MSFLSRVGKGGILEIQGVARGRRKNSGPFVTVGLGLIKIVDDRIYIISTYLTDQYIELLSIINF